MKNKLAFLLIIYPFLLSSQTVDSTYIKQVDSLLKLSKDLLEDRKFEKALEVNETAKILAIEKIGTVSKSYGNCCTIFGQIMDGKSDFPKAIEAFLEAKECWEKALGKEHIEYANSLSLLGVTYWKMGLYAKAESFHLEAIDLTEKLLGTEHIDYMNSLNNLGTAYSDWGKLDKAETLITKSKNLREKFLGREHPHYSMSLNNLAMLNLKLERLDQSKKYYLEALEIREKISGKAHPFYASILINIGILHARLGEYEKTEVYLIKAKDIFELLLQDERNPYYINCLNNLVVLYNHMGLYERGEPLLLKSLSIREKTMGKDNPLYMENLFAAINLYILSGKYEKAQQFLFEAKELQEKNLGKNHPKNAIVLNLLGLTFEQTEEHEKAEKFYLEAIGMFDAAAIDIDTLQYAGQLLSLAYAYYFAGQYQKAKPIFLKTRELREKILGKENMLCANLLITEGSMYHKLGDYEKAERLIIKGKNIYYKVLGKENHYHARCYHNLAMIYRESGQYEMAEKFFIDLTVANQTLVTKSLQHLSERELNIHLNKYSLRQSDVLSFVQMTGRDKLHPTCYDISLFHKGILLNGVNQIKRLAQSDSTSAELVNRLKGYQRLLAFQYAQPIARRDSSKIIKLESSSNAVEKELARTVAGYGNAIRPVTWKDVQQSLESDEAAIEFVHFKYRAKQPTDSIMYAALLLLPNSAQPQFYSLFEEKQLSDLLTKKEKGKSGEVGHVYSKNLLSKLLIQPFEKKLDNIQTIYYSPSGLLHRLNLNAIQIDETTFGEKYKLVQLNSTRQLAVGDKQLAVSSEKPNNALLFGGIQYNMDSTEIAAVNYDYDKVATRGSLSFNQPDSTHQSGSWDYLDWTEIEVAAIESVLKENNFNTTLRDGYQATEEAFKSIASPSPRILHIATHGFFFPDPQREDFPLEVEGEREPVFKLSDHPMIRSGLIMAGGNHAWQTGKPFKPNMEDGVLTAYEISQMDLSNTELVVLSACETGLGDIEGNEGVYGLQRAFKIAGAKYLIMSLWQVPDYQTQELMKAFYKKWLNDKMDIPDAFRAAQQMMKEKYDDPFLWAGFVLVE